MSKVGKLYIIILVSILLSIPLATHSIGKEYKMDVLASIDGKYLKLIEMAVKEFKTIGLNPDDYKITVMKKNDDAVVVVFTWSGTPQGFRGSPKEFPGYEVEIDTETGHVVRKNFSR
jgi:hypothetical protein